VLLWWGLFDQDLYVEHGDERYGPYHPAGGPIPLYRYRQHRKGRREKQADRIAALARALQVPRAALDGCPVLAPEPALVPPGRAFADPDPFREFTFSSRITPSWRSPRGSGCRWPGSPRRSAPSSTRFGPRPSSGGR
jgi:hypothetical protein